MSRERHLMLPGIILAVLLLVACALYLSGSEDPAVFTPTEPTDEQVAESPPSSARRRSTGGASHDEAVTTDSDLEDDDASAGDASIAGGEVRVTLLSHDGLEPVPGVEVALFRLARADEEAVSVDRGDSTLLRKRSRRRSSKSPWRRLGTDPESFARLWTVHLRRAARRLTTDENGVVCWQDVEPGPYRWAVVGGFRGTMQPAFEGAGVKVRDDGSVSIRSGFPEMAHEYLSGLFRVEARDMLSYEVRSIGLTTILGRVARSGPTKATIELQHLRYVGRNTRIFAGGHSKWAESDEPRFQFADVRAGKKTLWARWNDPEANRVSYAIRDEFDAPPGEVIDLGELKPENVPPLVVRIVTDDVDIDPAVLQEREVKVGLTMAAHDVVVIDPLRDFEFVGVNPDSVYLKLDGLEGLKDRAGRPVQLVQSRLEGAFPEQTLFEFRFELVPQYEDMVFVIPEAESGGRYEVKLFDTTVGSREYSSRKWSFEDRELVVEGLPPGQYIGVVNTTGLEQDRAAVVRVDHAPDEETRQTIHVPRGIRVRGKAPREERLLVGVGLPTFPKIDGRRPVTAFLTSIDDEHGFEFSSIPATERRLVYYDRRVRKERIFELREVDGEFFLDLTSGD